MKKLLQTFTLVSAESASAFAQVPAKQNKFTISGIKISLKNQKIIFWTITVLISAFFILSGYLEVTKNPATFPKTIRMGYPPYFIIVLGVAKLIGAVVFLFPKFRRLKEWIFAAFTFDVIFAFISGIAIQSYADCMKACMVFSILMLAYFLFLNIERTEFHRKLLKLRHY